MNRMQPYLANSEYIDWAHPTIVAKAAELAEHGNGESDVAKRCFELCARSDSS